MALIGSDRVSSSERGLGREMQAKIFLPLLKNFNPSLPNIVHIGLTKLAGCFFACIEVFLTNASKPEESIFPSMLPGTVNLIPASTNS